jgi:NADH:ubiquinone oxidoreductase subunit 6 (subunit J)
MKSKALKNTLLIVALLLIGAAMIFASIDIRLYIAYTVFAIAIVSFVGFAIYSLAANAKKSIGSIGAGAAIVGILMLFYFISPRTDVSAELLEKTGTGIGWSPIIGSGLYTVYLLLVIFVSLLAFFSVRNMLK